MPGPTPTPIELSRQEQVALLELTRRHRTSQQMALRARIVLTAAGQLSNTAIAHSLGVSTEMVHLWRSRWLSMQETPLQRVEP